MGEMVEWVVLEALTPRAGMEGMEALEGQG